MEHKKTHMCVERPIPRKVSRSYSCIFDDSSPYRARRLLRGEIDRSSLLFVGTLPEAHHAAQGRHAWSTFRERPGRRTHTHRDVRSSQDSATRMATRERSRKVTESYRQHSAGYFATTDTRPDLILFTELYTQSKITTAMERRLEIFLRLEVRRFTPTRGAVELAVADWR